MGPGFESLEVHQILSAKSKDLALFLYVGKRLHTFCTPFAQSAFLCIKMELVGARPLHLLSQTVLSLKHPTGVFVAFANAKALSEPGSRQFSAFICVHEPDGFKDLPAGDFCCRRLFVLPGLGCCRGQVLGIEVCFDLLGQFQPGLVLRVGIGVHWTFWFYEVIAGYPMQTVMRLSRYSAEFDNKKSPHNGPEPDHPFRDDLGSGSLCSDKKVKNLLRLLREPSWNSK